MKFSNFVEWVFYCLLGFLAYDMNSTMKDMSKSVNQLNTSMAIKDFQANNQENRILRLEGVVFKPQVARPQGEKDGVD